MKVWIWVIVIVVVLIAAYFLLVGNTSPTPTDQTTDATEEVDGEDATANVGDAVNGSEEGSSEGDSKMMEDKEKTE